MAGTSEVEEVRPSLIRIAAAMNREDKLREFESFFLQWRDSMHSLFADFRADFRESLHSKSVVDTSCLQPMIAESHDSLEVADDSITQIGQGPSIYGSNNCTEANPKDLEAATLTESNFIPANIQESHTSLVRDVNTEIDPCNYCLVDSQVQDHLLLVSNPEVVFNQSGHKRIDEQRSKGNSLIDPSQDSSLGAKSVEQGCVNPISFSDELQVITTPLEISASEIKKTGRIGYMVEASPLSVEANAYKVFDELPRREMSIFECSCKLNEVDSLIVIGDSYGSIDFLGSFVFDPGKSNQFKRDWLNDCGRNSMEFLVNVIGVC